MKDLKNKTAIVTGGSKGIGKGIVEKLAQSGCNVAFTYLSSEESAAEIEKLSEKYNVKIKKYQWLPLWPQHGLISLPQKMKTRKK